MTAVGQREARSRIGNIDRDCSGCGGIGQHLANITQVGLQPAGVRPQIRYLEIFLATPLAEVHAQSVGAWAQRGRATCLEIGMQTVIVNHGHKAVAVILVDIHHRAIVRGAIERVGSAGGDGERVGEANDEVVQTGVGRFCAANCIQCNRINVKA